MGRFLCFLFVLCSISWTHAENRHYDLVDDPIDAVIVTHPRDKKTIDLCINGLRKNCNGLRRVIVVSSENLTDEAEWFNENQFPFNKADIASTITRGDKKRAKSFFKGVHYSPGWYFQQLLKLYSPFVIPGISTNVLVVDADTIFMNPVEFLNDSFGALFCTGTERVFLAYFEHAKRLVPDYERIYPDVYSVCHHMLFQKAILEDLFRTVEDYHEVPFWEAFCLSVNFPKNEGASEFEIYYNYALRHTDQVGLRELKWMNSPFLKNRKQFEKEGYHFVSFHKYMRDNRLNSLIRFGRH
jgi:hypothetical protein